MNYGQYGKRLTKKDIIMYLQKTLRSSSYEIVSDFETIKARHICSNGTKITLLDKQVIPVQVDADYVVNVEVFVCPCCRKLLINGSTLEFL